MISPLLAIVFLAAPMLLGFVGETSITIGLEDIRFVVELAAVVAGVVTIVWRGSKTLSRIDHIVERVDQLKARVDRHDQAEDEIRAELADVRTELARIDGAQRRH